MDAFFKARNYAVHQRLSEHVQLTKCRCLIVEAGAAKVNASYTATLLKLMMMVGSQHAIVIHDTPANTSVANVLKDLKHFVRVELIEKNFLHRALLSHTLVPQHRLATPNEICALGKATCSKLPVILQTDPVVRYHDWRQQSIIRVDRHDGSVAFRIVK